MTSLSRLRAANRRTVAAALADGPLSRADVARLTGLSRTTVSSLVGDLIESGLVSETSARGRPHKGGGGRPSVLLRLSVPVGHVAGVDIGHGHVRVAVADRAGSIVGEQVAPVAVDTRGTEAFDVAARMVGETQATTGVGALAAVGMCVPGPLDRTSSRVSNRIMPGWRGLDPADELGRRLGLPVVADNDANLGALAELGHGAGRAAGPAADLVYVKLASGLGAGIVLGGRLHRGSSGNAGEIGHVQVGEDGAVCRCGNRGCLETLVAAPRLVELLRPAYDEGLDVAQVLELDAAGDAGVRRVLSDAGRAVGRALADLATSLNPELVVLGGSLGRAASLVDAVRASIDRYAQPDTAAALQVLPGELGERAEVVGAVSLALTRASQT
ncbi:ROK family transcriptional regulator [Nocardioides rubriscoriae]|uniref:ROK family transcriptional regulator n=1 Tax=Nocardioides rubriscoriae TaxID=642762 RepID=UPI0011DF9EE9|nr:ROK family transcriptional regulator [Nocardioides rubriscoriae]